MTAMPLPATRTPRDTGASRHVAILLAVWRVPAAFMVFQMYATPLINGTPVPPVCARSFQRWPNGSSGFR
jgi:hypothetical protein